MSDFQEMRCGACGNTEAKIQAEPTVGMYGFSAFRFICKCGCISEFRVGGYIHQNVLPKGLPENSQDGSWCVGWRKKEEPEKPTSPTYILLRRKEWPPDLATWKNMEDIELDKLPVEIKPWVTARDGTLIKAEAFWDKNTVPASNIHDAMGKKVFDEDVNGVLYFIDLYPEANWAHGCLYILHVWKIQ
jgi:hypothetical protein